MAFVNGREAALAALDTLSLALLRHGPRGLADRYPALLARHVAPRLYAGVIARVRANLAALRPDLPPDAVGEAMEHLARTMCESAVFPRLMRDGRVEVRGAGHLGAGPALVVGVHLGCWPLTAAAAARAGHDCIGPHAPPPNARRARALARAFAQTGARLLPPGEGSRGRALLRHLRDGKTVLMFVDADARAPGLGRPTPEEGGNMEATVRLAHLTGLRPILAHCERLLPGQGGLTRHRVTFAAPLPLPKDRAAAVAALDAAVGALVRARLTQWLFLPDFRAEG